MTDEERQALVSRRQQLLDEAKRITVQLRQKPIRTLKEICELKEAKNKWIWEQREAGRALVDIADEIGISPARALARANEYGFHRNYDTARKYEPVLPKLLLDDLGQYPVEAVYWSTHTYNALRVNGIKTLEDLRDEVLNPVESRHLGTRARNEMKHALQQYLSHLVSG